MRLHSTFMLNLHSAVQYHNCYLNTHTQSVHAASTWQGGKAVDNVSLSPPFIVPEVLLGGVLQMMIDWEAPPGSCLSS